MMHIPLGAPRSKHSQQTWQLHGPVLESSHAFPVPSVVLIASFYAVPLQVFQFPPVILFVVLLKAFETPWV